ncbi:c-type cytochrome [Larkinella soli]|uniref:c-type cytochrome n=1 Tax=Larkinella soli TaxID=1770527 RepID=UPI000FFBB1CC|nr:c-type cytochrome [Larkinella soli]
MTSLVFVFSFITLLLSAAVVLTLKKTLDPGWAFRPALFRNTVRRGKILKGVLLVLRGLFGLLMAALLVLYAFFPLRTPVPEGIVARHDTALIARGRYLAEAVLACNQCHAPRDFSRFSGPVIPGRAWEGTRFPAIEKGLPGVLFGANLTPAHLGTWSDGELYRLLTTGIRKNGEPVFPIMSYPAFSRMDPADVRAVIAYLRTLRPVTHAMPESRISFPLNLIMRAFPRAVEPIPLNTLNTPEQKGEYLVTIAHCAYCHTPVKNGQEVEEMAFAGGHEFTPPTGGIVRSPNLTPARTGLGTWTEEAFLSRFKAYRDTTRIHRVEAGGFNSVMPWTLYARMTDEDLRNIYRYLRTLKPIEHPVERFSAPR